MTTDTLNNTPTNKSADADRHNSKMAKKKVARDKIMATKTEARG